MAVPILEASTVIEPVRRLSESPGVLAVIVGIDGPSYRPLGAMMALLDDGTRVGTLSSGCVEADVALQAEKAAEAGIPQLVRYGKGSRYGDIQLPCGGGLDIALIPSPDNSVLAEVCARHQARVPLGVRIDLNTGEIKLAEPAQTGPVAPGSFHVQIDPEIFFFVFGKGPEAATFASLVQSAGYPNMLLSPDEETLDAGRHAGCATRHLTSARFPDYLCPDARSAIVLFFHDHDWEPPILAAAAQTPAFYIGAQGSQRAAQARRYELEAMGLAQADLARIRGPIGLIPSVRDARKLAVSVLAEVLHQG